MIDIVNVYKEFLVGDEVVYGLYDVSLRLEKGEFVGIVGQSGSGKSTLMNILGCIDRPTSGQYFLENEEVSEKNDDELSFLRNRHIGIIFQSYNLLPRLTAIENVELPLLYRKVKKRERQEFAVYCLERVGLSHRIHYYPNQLSGGQQQRVAIARTLSASPSILLADELTGALDTASGAEIMAIINQLNTEDEITIILVTHDWNVARQCKRVIEIQDGQIVSDRC